MIVSAFVICYIMFQDLGRNRPDIICIWRALFVREKKKGECSDVVVLMIIFSGIPIIHGGQHSHTYTILFFCWKWQNNFFCFLNLFTFQIPTATIARTSSWNLSCERRRRNRWTDRPGVWMTSLPCERKRTPMWPIRWSSWKTSFATCPCWKVANPRISWNVSSRVYCEFSIYTDRYI